MEPLIEFNETYNFWVMKAPEGYVLTGWTESQPIEEYNYFSIAYLPENSELSEIEAITEAKAEEYRKLQEDYYKALESPENSL